MQNDIRETALYREVEALQKTIRRPGSGLVSDAAEISTNGTHAVFAGTIVDELIGVPPTRICLTDLTTGDTRVLTFGPNVDRLPKFSPDGARIAFLSDRHKADDFQLYLLDPISGETTSTPRVDGWVEYLHWSPDGTRVLLGVAGHGADISGAQGAVTSKQVTQDVPSWMPVVEAGDENYRWRRAWVYVLANCQVRQVSRADINIWEAVWCGNGAIAAVVSPEPREGLWYSACLCLLDIETGNSRQIYEPRNQIGCAGASPSGRRLAIVEAISSDRWLVAGDLRLVDTTSDRITPVNTSGVDVTYTEWVSDSELLVAGHREFETVVGVYDANSETFTEIWASRDITTGGRYAAVSGLDAVGDCVLVAEGFLRAPEIGVIRKGKYLHIKSFDLGYANEAKAIAAVEPVSWNAPDGLEIQGWLLRPSRNGPHALVMNIHGGPVWQWRSLWLGRAGAWMLMLVKHGYAVFFPNPRGSTGRGQDFARYVLGDMGGADAQDCLSALDHLVEKKIADPRRLGVTGGSYGGFMTSWLITQDARFAAAVPLAPVSNHVTEHLISNIPHFVSMFLADTYDNLAGKYYQRSPVLHVDKVKTPTLCVCGALDRCTPPEEAIQFHNALLEKGATSVLLTYPEEGHGIRKWPAAIDYAARVVAWFEKYMPSR